MCARVLYQWQGVDPGLLHIKLALSSHYASIAFQPSSEPLNQVKTAHSTIKEAIHLFAI